MRALRGEDAAFAVARSASGTKAVGQLGAMLVGACLESAQALLRLDLSRCAGTTASARSALACGARFNRSLGWLDV